MTATKEDWQAWRRLEKSDERWEKMEGFLYRDCTIGTAWGELQKRMFQTVVPDAELGMQFEYVVAPVGQDPDDLTLPRKTTRSQTYRDRMMRAMR